MKILIITLLITLFIIPMVNAEQEIPISYTFKQNDNVQIKIPCLTASGSLCSSSAICNTTVIIDKNHTIYIDNIKLTNQIQYHNYSFNTSIIDEFTHIVNCKDGAFNGTSIFRTETNPIGISSTSERTNALNGGVWIIFILALFFLSSGTILKTKPIVRITLLIFGAIFLLMTINNVGVIMRNAAVDPSLVTLFESLTAVSYYIYMALGFAVFVMWMFSIVLSLNDINKRKHQEKYSYEN